ncbi:MAG: hypothetical protein QXQ81_06360, partial [Candidatus Thorarchaeota archaeon]
RIFVRITVIPGLELTPGFMFSMLGGIVGGLPGGIVVGSIVGIGGAIAGGETPLLPLIGNICLGVGTGIGFYVDTNRNSLRYYTSVIVGGTVIGGFIPTLTIFSGFEFVAALIPALADAFQAFIWAVLALLIDLRMVRPLLGPHLYLSEGQN